MIETTYCLKLSTLSLLHDPAGQPEQGLIAPQHTHHALDTVAHTCSLQHTGNCTLCLLLNLQHAQKLHSRCRNKKEIKQQHCFCCPFHQQSLFTPILTVCDHNPLITGGSYDTSLL